MLENVTKGNGDNHPYLATEKIVQKIKFSWKIPIFLSFLSLFIESNLIEYQNNFLNGLNTKYLSRNCKCQHNGK